MPEDGKPSPRFLTVEEVVEGPAISEVQIRSMLKASQLKGERTGRRNVRWIGRLDLEDSI